LLLLAVVSIAPVLLLTLTALGKTGRYPQLWASDLDASVLAPLLGSSALWSAFRTSVLLALCTGVGATGLAFLAARMLSRATARVRRIGSAAAFLPVIAPPIALGLGVQVLAIRAHLGGSWFGVLAAHVVPASGYLTVFLAAVLTSYDATTEDAARSLGATPWTVLTRVTLPALRTPLTQSVALGALVSWGQLALTLVVGGGVVRSLPVELLAFVQSGDDRLGAAAALLLTIPPALVLGVSQSGARRTGAIA
jgi:putative spermidine/putrescine transport system permease protein